MFKKIYSCELGDIHYWVNDFSDRATLVFLPGLSADHRLFERQLAYFGDKYNVLVWDAPGHNLSRPFNLSFNLFDMARWLREILVGENIVKPIIVGQSMGGYVAQAFLELFPGELGGFVSIDSAPLQSCYIGGWELWLLERMEPIYKLYPWKWLVRQGSVGVACSEYGINLMSEMMLSYDRDYYAKLVGHGYRMVAECYRADLAYELSCPTILICGDKDRAGSTRRYNIRWAKKMGLPLYMVENAGHNSNTDGPDEVNRLIEDFVESL